MSAVVVSQQDRECFNRSFVSKIHDAIWPVFGGDARADFKRVVAPELSSDPPEIRSALPTMISAKNIGHHMTRIGLCSAS